jgi:hypothetical protein
VRELRCDLQVNHVTLNDTDPSLDIIMNRFQVSSRPFLPRVWRSRKACTWMGGQQVQYDQRPQLYGYIDTPITEGKAHIYQVRGNLLPSSVPRLMSYSDSDAGSRHLTICVTIMRDLFQVHGLGLGLGRVGQVLDMTCYATRAGAPWSAERVQCGAE